MKILEEKAKQGLRQWHVVLTKTTVVAINLKNVLFLPKLESLQVYKARAQGTCWQKDLFVL